jgi:hypothetical protein
MGAATHSAAAATAVAMAELRRTRTAFFKNSPVRARTESPIIFSISMLFCR